MQHGTIIHRIVQEAVEAAGITKEDLHAVNACLGAELPTEFRLTRGHAVMARIKKFCLRQMSSHQPEQFARILLGGHLTIPMQRLNLTSDRVSDESVEDALVLRGETSDEVALDLAALIVLAEIMMNPTRYRLSPRCPLEKIYAHSPQT